MWKVYIIKYYRRILEPTAGKILVDGKRYREQERTGRCFSAVCLVPMADCEKKMLSLA